MTYIEELSNELFYEIFEYLNGCEIYGAFSNLNIRFQNLLTYSTQPLKIDLQSESELILQQYCEQVIIPNKNRIISLRLRNMLATQKVFGLILVDSSLSRLESIILNETKYKVLSFLRRLMALPRLFSLTLQLTDNWPIFKPVYEHIFQLPVLKYCKISSESDRYFICLFPVKGEFISSIKCLIINHGCTINELSNLLSFTPQLYYLTCKFFKASRHQTKDVSIHLPNLKYISITNCDVHFAQFEIFSKTIHCPLEVLRFKTTGTMDYIDANKWEQLILHHMPHLQTFYFQCSAIVNQYYTLAPGREKSTGFTSLFWIERQWIFELKIDVDKARRINMTYMIHPYRKRWCEDDDNRCRFIAQNSEQSMVTANQQGVNHSSIHHLQSIELILTGSCFVEDYQCLISNQYYLFDYMQISRLNIDNYEPSIGLLIKLLDIIPHIHSLRISLFPMVFPKYKLLKETEGHDFVSNSNNIMKVCLGKMDEFKVNDFVLMNLWHQVQYLEMACIKDVNIEMIIEIILKNYTNYVPRLRSLCLCLVNINHQMVEQLRTVIDLQKLHDNYTIKLETNKLYLQWK